MSKSPTLCMGEHCPVKNACLRYTAAQATLKDFTQSKKISHCTNQKKFVKSDQPFESLLSS